VTERNLLQIVVGLASLVPICAGAAGALLGPAMVDVLGAPAAADSHYRYLSGLLLGIGIGFATTITRIEAHSARFRLLAALVVIGGIARLLSLVVRGYSGKPVLFALVMELIVTPALVVWQARVAQMRR
jgi:uncharacterized protein DUF4345